MLVRALDAGLLALVLLVAGLAGCATAPPPPGPGRLVTDPPVRPAFERSFTTPWGREWGFQVGGYPWSDR